MTLPKYFYTLDEVSEKLNCSINDLLHSGLVGKIELCFDLCLISAEIAEFDLPFSFKFKLLNKPISECPESFQVFAQGFQAYTNNDHLLDPSMRLFSLTPAQISLIQKYGFIELKKHNDKVSGISFELLANKTDAFYPKIKLSDILIEKMTYNALIKRHSHAEVDTSLDSSFYIHEDAMSNMQFVTLSMSQDVWPIPVYMNKPTKNQLFELIDKKGYEFNQTEKEAIIKVSTPDNIILGGKPNNEKSDFQPKCNRKK